MYAEDRIGVVSSLRLLHPRLPVEKGGALRKENRKCGHPGIDHLVYRGIALATAIWKAFENGANQLGQAGMGGRRSGNDGGDVEGRFS